MFFCSNNALAYKIYTFRRLNWAVRELLIFFLARLGIVSARQLVRWYKWAILVIFVVAAIITPTPDIATQSVFAVPMMLLYGLGIVVAALFGRKED